MICADPLATPFPRVLLVGEGPTRPGPALCPDPPSGSGGRLCRILGLTPEAYLARFDRVNLMPGSRWSLSVARAAAINLKHPRRILLGARVCQAHRLSYEPFASGRRPGYAWLILPHPSGRCRTWNESEAAPRAREAVANFLDNY